MKRRNAKLLSCAMAMVLGLLTITGSAMVLETKSDVSTEIKADEKTLENAPAAVDTFSQMFAIIDAGSNMNGSYVQFSNGFQICWHSMIVKDDHPNFGLKTGWIYPKDFKDMPVLSILPVGTNGRTVTANKYKTAASVCISDKTPANVDAIAIGYATIDEKLVVQK